MGRKSVPVTWKNRTLDVKRFHSVDQRKFFAHAAWGSRDVIEAVRCNYSQLVRHDGKLKELVMFLGLKGADDPTTFKPLDRLQITMPKNMTKRFQPLEVWLALDKVRKIQFAFDRESIETLLEDGQDSLLGKFARIKNCKDPPTSISMSYTDHREVITLLREPRSPGNKDAMAFLNLGESVRKRPGFTRTLSDRLGNGKKRNVDLRVALLLLNHERKKERSEEDRMEVDEAEDALEERFNFPQTWQQFPSRPRDPSPLRSAEILSSSKDTVSSRRKNMIPVGVNFKSIEDKAKARPDGLLQQTQFRCSPAPAL